MRPQVMVKIVAKTLSWTSWIGWVCGRAKAYGRSSRRVTWRTLQEELYVCHCPELPLPFCMSRLRLGHFQVCTRLIRSTHTRVPASPASASGKPFLVSEYIIDSVSQWTATTELIWPSVVLWLLTWQPSCLGTWFRIITQIGFLTMLLILFCIIIFKFCTC